MIRQTARHRGHHSDGFVLPATNVTHEENCLHGIVAIQTLVRGIVESCVLDGEWGFWAALRKVFPTTREQRCWVHKTANVLNKMPKSVQPKAKGDLHEIWQAATKEDAEKAFNAFFEKFEAKYGQACVRLRKDRDVLLAFYDFPAEHWSHLRTSNPIESTFATIRLRYRKTKGNGTRRASLAMMFKLAQSASKKWRRLNCHEKIAFVIEGRSFKDGIMPDEIAV